MNEDGATPVTDQPAEGDQPIQEQDQETLAPNENYEPETDLVSNPVPESADEPAEDNAQIEGAPVVEEEDEPLYQPQALPEVPSVDINAFMDEEGNLRLADYQTAQAQLQSAVIQRSVAQATEQIRMERAYEKEWQKAEDKYPELKANKQMRAMVKAIHVDSPSNGKYLSPTKAADQIMSMLGKTKTAGMQQAQETRRTQAAAQLAVSNPAQTVNTDRNRNLKETMKSGATLHERYQARDAYILDLVENGQL